MLVWAAQLRNTEELRGCQSYVRAVQIGRVIPMQGLTAGLKHRG